MYDVTNHPLILFALSFIALWFAAWIGALVRKRKQEPEEGWRDVFGVVQAASLTLLGLIIGFSFSMATGRYDQRKNYEEEEANAVGTEYLRADLLPDTDSTKVRALLRRYLDQRILFYTTHDAQLLDQVDTRTAALQSELWLTVKAPATTQPTPVAALVVSGMNDVLNSQGYAQAAWWNRIPTAAWGLMAGIAIFCNLLIGYGAPNSRLGAKLLLVLPFVISISFMLIADIDSPRHGIIRVSPQNLDSLRHSISGR